jgi:prevent-host-death family protein
MTRVSASEFQREFGRLRVAAHRDAVVVTNHGRDDVVLISAEEYQRLKRLDQQMVRTLDWIESQDADVTTARPQDTGSN